MVPAALVAATPERKSRFVGGRLFECRSRRPASSRPSAFWCRPEP